MNKENNKRFLTLCEAYKNYFAIGAAVNPQDLVGPHGELLKKHFSSLVAENCMKFEETEALEGKFNYEKSDRIVEFAVKNHMKMRGHTFVWHGQTPAWVFLDENGNTASKELLLKRMKKHIDALSEHYKDKVYAWDVVNEAIEDIEGEQYRKSSWYSILGEDFIKYAFEYARMANPKAILFYNDYNNEKLEKLNKTYDMLKNLLAKGVPIDGVGLQAHTNINDKDFCCNLRNAIEKYASLGLKVQITEMEISMFSFADRSELVRPSEKMLELQAELYGKSFALFREYKEIVTGVTLWGISDKYTWKDNFPVKNRKDWPLLFDINYGEKEAFYKVVNF